MKLFRALFLTIISTESRVKFNLKLFCVGGSEKKVKYCNDTMMVAHLASFV